jgi:hypothetical protein
MPQKNYNPNAAPRSPVRVTLPDLNLLKGLPLRKLKDLRIAVGRAGGLSDPGYKTITALINTKTSQGAKK